MKPKILITNDDGIHAPGIKALWNALKDHCHCTVIAPHKEQSATGLSITVRDPIRVEKHLWEETIAWAVTGTPADSVKMALSVLLEDKPDLIVSGINKGSNAGRNVLYSGTVSAVIEGALQNIPGVAFSCWDYIDPDYSLATPWVKQIVDHALSHPLPEGTLFNVNFPAKADHPYKGVKLCRQGKGYWKENPDPRSHPSEGHPYWWLGLMHADYEEEPNSDIHLLKEGYISAVPVYVGDLTHDAHLKERQALFESAFRLEAQGTLPA
ncbi:MAG: 5'/3'-nucleotidase SurE [Chlamydiia bacterium]|nr:5'/3'-nucleotidase SurE [Chlamydiia bacterium]